MKKSIAILGALLLLCGCVKHKSEQVQSPFAYRWHYNDYQNGLYYTIVPPQAGDSLYQFNVENEQYWVSGYYVQMQYRNDSTYSLYLVHRFYDEQSSVFMNIINYDKEKGLLKLSFSDDFDIWEAGEYLFYNDNLNNKVNCDCRSPQVVSHLHAALPYSRNSMLYQSLTSSYYVSMNYFSYTTDDEIFQAKLYSAGDKKYLICVDSSVGEYNYTYSLESFLFTIEDGVEHISFDKRTLVDDDKVCYVCLDEDSDDITICYYNSENKIEKEVKMSAIKD